MTPDASATSSANKFNEQLKNKPILATLLLLNPLESIAQRGYKLSESDAKQFKAPSAEDLQQTQNLLKNNLNVTEPQVIQAPKNEELLSAPRLASHEFNREADITTNISTEVIKFSLASFAGKNFIGRKFNEFPTEDWWTLQAVGESLNVEVSESGIEILVDFQCQLSIHLDLSASKLEADKIKFPLTVEITPAFVVTGNQIYLSISKGQISLLNFVYPQRLAENLSHAIAEIIPYIPLFPIPTRLDLLGNEPDPAVLLTGSEISQSGVSLSFHINEDFEFKTNSPETRKKSGKGAVAFLSDSWVGQDSLWNYPNYDLSEETAEQSCGHAVMATISDFFGRNPFGLAPKEEPFPDGKAHYDNAEAVGKFYDWYYPEDNLGATQISGRDTLMMAFTNLKFNPQEYHLEDSGNATEAQRKLVDWITNKRLPVVVLLDMGELKVLEDLATGKNEAAPKDSVAHWAIVYAVNNAGVKMASWGKEYFIPWKIFMNAWNCSFLPHPNNFYQIQMSV